MNTPITQPVEKIFVDLKDARPLVKIGWAGENQARGIVWDISKWQELYGEGTCTLLNQREQDTAPYPCTVDIDGKFAVWQVTDADLGTGGNGKCQLIYQVGEEVVAKSPVYKTLAERSLGGVTIVETPDWVLQVIQAGADAVDAAERAEDAAKKAEDTADGATEAINSAATAGIQAVNAAGQAAIGAVGNAQTSAVSAVNDAKNTGVQAVNDAKETAVEAVQGAQTAALNAISEAKTQATEAVGTAKTQAVQAVEDAENTGVSAVEDAKSNALTEVGEVKTTAVDAVNAAGTQATSAAKTAITGAKNQAVSDVQNAGQSAVKAVGDAQTSAEQAVETAQTNAVQSVQAAGAAEAEKINDILPAPTEADAGKVPVAKPDGSGYELGSQIDDTKIGITAAWSSENIVQKLCPPFTTEGAIVTCNPVESSRLNAVVQIEPVQEGEGDPSPENIRPISGWDAVKIWRGGKNLFPNFIVDKDYSNGSTVRVNPDGSITVHKVAGESINQSAKIALPAGEYILWNGLDSGNKIYIQIADNATFSDSSAIYKHLGGETILYLYSDTQTTGDITIFPTLIPFGMELLYKPYHGETFTIPFGQTVYGGTLDVTTGVLTKTHENIPSYAGEDVGDDWMSSTGSLTDGAQVVYRLKNPVSTQLTPKEILALSGVNTVYADAGDVAVSGYSDPTTIINSLADRIAALEQNAIGG